MEEEPTHEKQNNNTEDRPGQNEDEITIDLEDDAEEDEEDEEEAMKAAMGFTSFQSSTSRDYYSKPKPGGLKTGVSPASDANKIPVVDRGVGTSQISASVTGSASLEAGDTGAGNTMPVHLSKKRRVDDAGVGADEGEEGSEGEHGGNEQEREYGHVQEGASGGEKHALFKESFIRDPWEGLLPTRLPPLK